MAHSAGNNTEKKKRTEGPKYAQKYRSEWELKPEFSKWLSVSNSSQNFAFCKICRCELQARLVTIRLHGKSAKHTSLMSSMSGSSQVCNVQHVNTTKKVLAMSEFSCFRVSLKLQLHVFCFIYM